MTTRTQEDLPETGAAGTASASRVKPQAPSALEAEALRLDDARNNFLGNRHAANGHGAKGNCARGNGDRMAVPLAAIPLHLSGEIAATVDLNEDAIAVVFASAHQGKLLYDAQRGKWYRWEGTHWRQDDGARVTREMIRRTVRKMCRGEPRWLTARMIDAVEKLSRTDERTCPRGTFDAEPLLLGTPGGVIDLRDGTTRTARPEDLMTRLTGTMPAFGTPCERWLGLLGACIHGFGPDGEPRSAPPGDTMVRFLQRVCGYFLTGSTRHEFVFLLFGGGANGKSTFLRVLREILGDYFVSVAVETFLQTAHDQHPTGMAHIEGARLAACGELPDNRSWNSQRVKDISSGEKMSARHMRQDFYDFVPVCKLLFVGNHRPRLRQVDEAEKRRFRVIPFIHKVPESQRDPKLEDALREEYPAILAWMIEGAQAVIAEGFGTMPAAVTQATDEYFAENDTFALWAAERLLLHKDLSVRAGLAYSNYRRWFEENGHEGRPVSPREFKARMTGMGAIHERSNSERLYRGVALNIGDDDEP
ncbi:phage/plasmid primase, P4 family [Paraburkholderia sp. A3BS-1L]|uniref:phage/plasmid primase, P4 family n=1 Tax=Paraburkholderia sp. A3BS-1L TaxID=3028375 RepID=UPI003DA96DC3